MTNEQWEKLLAVLDGHRVDPAPVGFIIDSPWLPGWAGTSILDYYADGERWLEANLRAVTRWPDILFLPGFWSEYGMCTEPSAFGARCMWHENEFPFADKIADSLDAALAAPVPVPGRDGMTPFVLKRLAHTEARIRAAGHAVRFAVARGPLNIAGFLLGNTEFLMGMKIEPDKTHALLDRVTDFLCGWVQAQKAAFPDIGGVLVLDDLVGFCGPEDCVEFANPYLARLFAALDVPVRFFHNDAHGLVCALHLEAVGVNLFNFSHEHPIAEMRRLAGDRVALLGNIPPRDILAQGTPEDVAAAVTALRADTKDMNRVLLSCGGGMPPGVSSENIDTFLAAASAMP